MILELKGIYKEYQQGKMKVPVLKNVDFSMEEGEYVAIMGPSGSGKTTLMNIIGCLDRPQRKFYSGRAGYPFLYGKYNVGYPSEQDRFCIPEFSSSPAADSSGECGNAVELRKSSQKRTEREST